MDIMKMMRVRMRMKIRMKKYQKIGREKVSNGISIF